MAKSSSQRVPRMHPHYSNGQSGTGSPALPLVPSVNGQAAMPVPTTYLREPRRRFFNAACRRLMLERFGLVMRNVPLPRYSAW